MSCDAPDAPVATEVAACDVGSSTNTSTSDVSTAPTPEKVVSRGNNSMMTTAGIIVADVVGAGILAMPVAIAQFGWLLGTVVLTSMLFANVHTSILLWRVRMVCPHAHTFGELCAAAFAKAPPRQRRLATVLTEWPQMMCIFSMSGLYLLSAARGLGMLFYDVRICLPQWAIIAGMIVLPFIGTSRQMGSFRALIWANILTLMGTVLIPLIYMAMAGAEEVRPEGSQVEAFSSLTSSGVLGGLSTMTFGFTSQIVLVEIIDEMKDPSELPKAYVGVSAPFQWVAFLVAGVGGYLFIGNMAVGMIDENIPFGPAFRVAALCMATHMLVTYYIKSVVFCKATHARVDPKGADSRDARSWVTWNAVTVFVLVSAYLLANIVPFFNAAVDLIGASLQPWLCYMLPVGLFLRVYKDAEEKPKIHWVEWVVMSMEVALALVLLTFGTISVIERIVEEWHSFGLPFACHCQGMWDTCSCSSDHVGMADQCAAGEVALPFV